MNRKTLNIILFPCLVFALACVKTKPPVQNDQWFCKAISDRPTDSVSLSVQPHQRAVAYKDKWWPVGYQFKQPPTTGSVTLTAIQVDSIINRYNKTVSSFDSAAREVKTTGDLIKSLLGRK